MKAYRFIANDNTVGKRLFDTVFVGNDFKLAVFRCKSFSKLLAKRYGKPIAITVTESKPLNMDQVTRVMKSKRVLREKYPQTTAAFILHVAS